MDSSTIGSANFPNTLTKMFVKLRSCIFQTIAAVNSERSPPSSRPATSTAQIG
jgi:hypothetical protein